MPTPRAPLPYESNSGDFEDQLAGRFRVLHTAAEKFEMTWDKPNLTALQFVSERPLRWLWESRKRSSASRGDLDSTREASQERQLPGGIALAVTPKREERNAKNETQKTLAFLMKMAGEL